MKKFFEYLFEQMSFSDAMKVFGIDSVPNKADLDKLYKKLALKNHPDLGGSEEKMKEINQAKDVLDKKAGSSVSTSGGYSKEQRAENDKEYAIFVQKVYAELQMFDLAAYEAHLKKIFNVPFKSTLKISNRDSRAPHLVSIGLEFADEKRDKVFYLFIMADTFTAFWDAKRGKGLASADKTIYRITTRSDVMIDGKKQALTKTTYVNSNETKIFTDPEILLPTKRLTKFATGEARKNSKVAKRDFIGLFTTVFDGKHEKNGSEDWFYFTTKEGFVVCFRRYTLGGAGGYQVMVREVSSSPYYRYERKPKTPDEHFIHTIAESPFSLEYLKEFLKKLDTFKTKKAIVDFLDDKGEELCGYKYKNL